MSECKIVCKPQTCILAEGPWPHAGPRVLGVQGPKALFPPNLFAQVKQHDEVGSVDRMCATLATCNQSGQGEKQKKQNNYVKQMNKEGLRYIGKTKQNK